MAWCHDRHVVVQVVDGNGVVLSVGGTIVAGGADGDGASGSGFAVDRPGDGDLSGGSVDGELSCRVVIECVEYAVGGGISIAGERGNADGRSDSGMLIDSIRRGVVIADCSDVELVEIVDADGVVASGGGSVIAGGADGDGASGSCFAVDRPGDGDLSGGSVDGELSRRVIVERAENTVRRGISIAGERSNADGRPDSGILIDSIRRGVGIIDCSDVELVHVCHGN